ncbi:MAG: rod shape-determining protein RodA [Bacteroidales bacterium]|nr:rod shape-determining protein RodA [Bacteroidales bacterium]
MEYRRSKILGRIDWLTVLMYLALVIFGFVNIYSSAFREDHSQILDFSQRYGKQFYWIVAAFILAIMGFMINTRFYYFFAYPIYFLSLLSLLAVLVVGATIHGSRSWIPIGAFRIQPAEFAKVATSLALAKYLSYYNRSLDQIKTLLNVSLMILAPAILIMLQPDMGSTLVYVAFVLVLYREGLPASVLIVGFLFALLFFMTLVLDKTIVILGLLVLTVVIHLFLEKKVNFTLKGVAMILLTGIILWAGSKLTGRYFSVYTIIVFSLIIAGVVFIPFFYRYKLKKSAILYVVLLGSVFFAFSVSYVFNNILEEHQRTRINIVLGIESDPYGSGYNVNQSKIAIGSGGFKGKGFLHGTQTKFNFVPEQSTDFIFCTVGEEWGFVGTFLVIAFYVMFLLRILMLAERQRSAFNRIYGYSVFSLLGFHVFVNIGMTIGLFPVIGIPLPFFSYGGSSLWAFTILLFVFLRMDADRMEIAF